MSPTIATPHCSSCLRLMQNRTFQHCAWCGHAVPATLLFTAEEIAEVHERARVEKKKADALSANGKSSVASGGIDASDVVDIVDGIAQALDLSDLF
ncbi:hypothetical protein [Undibacterium parvum]|uniref:Uncharacterized protein n=1 Tax=Undibacterium parvum TaxID=401471 RepID=A0A3Q9BPQ5_9BURK|nr:hypothetical protein [Undibacterium parvum]AZP11661.1 hypothetical protein EJN92_06425 [Undibacterium parvum]